MSLLEQEIRLEVVGSDDLPTLIVDRQEQTVFRPTAMKERLMLQLQIREVTGE